MRPLLSRGDRRRARAQPRLQRLRRQMDDAPALGGRHRRRGGADLARRRRARTRGPDARALPADQRGAARLHPPDTRLDRSVLLRRAHRRERCAVPLPGGRRPLAGRTNAVAGRATALRGADRRRPCGRSVAGAVDRVPEPGDLRVPARLRRAPRVTPGRATRSRAPGRHAARRGRSRSARGRRRGNRARGCSRPRRSSGPRTTTSSP